jgi:hypothetical protein
LAWGFFVLGVQLWHNNRVNALSTISGSAPALNILTGTLAVLGNCFT